jgi:hypothetical protein
MEAKWNVCRKPNYVYVDVSAVDQGKQNAVLSTIDLRRLTPDHHEENLSTS